MRTQRKNGGAYRPKPVACHTEKEWTQERKDVEGYLHEITPSLFRGTTLVMTHWARTNVHELC